ncbi:MAG TPA: YaiI/YqxD family protein [Acidiferrobacterales bacterium]|jgi:hypothetical protein
MHIWVDADACPKVIKEILFRAAERRQLPVTLVANRPLAVPASRFIRSRVVPGGFDEADKLIIASVAPGDLVVSADIPLAAEVVAQGALTLSPRGTLYTRDNISEHLSMRDLKDELRKSGMDLGGPPALSHKDRQAFANQLDRLLSRGDGR